MYKPSASCYYFTRRLCFHLRWFVSLLVRKIPQKVKDGF